MTAVLLLTTIAIQTYAAMGHIQAGARVKPNPAGVSAAAAANSMNAAPFMSALRLDLKAPSLSGTFSPTASPGVSLASLQPAAGNLPYHDAVAARLAPSLSPAVVGESRLPDAAPAQPQVSVLESVRQTTERIPLDRAGAASALSALYDHPLRQAADDGAVAEGRIPREVRVRIVPGTILKTTEGRAAAPRERLEPAPAAQPNGRAFAKEAPRFFAARWGSASASRGLHLKRIPAAMSTLRAALERASHLAVHGTGRTRSHALLLAAASAAVAGLILLPPGLVLAWGGKSLAFLLRHADVVGAVIGAGASFVSLIRISPMVMMMAGPVSIALGAALGAYLGWGVMLALAGRALAAGCALAAAAAMAAVGVWLYRWVRALSDADPG